MLIDNLPYASKVRSIEYAKYLLKRGLPLYVEIVDTIPIVTVGPIVIALKMFIYVEYEVII